MVHAVLRCSNGPVTAVLRWPKGGPPVSRAVQIPPILRVVTDCRPVQISHASLQGEGCSGIITAPSPFTQNENAAQSQLARHRHSNAQTTLQSIDDLIMKSKARSICAAPPTMMFPFPHRMTEACGHIYGIKQHIPDWCSVLRMHGSRHAPAVWGWTRTFLMSCVEFASRPEEFLPSWKQPSKNVKNRLLGGTRITGEYS